MKQTQTWKAALGAAFLVSGITALTLTARAAENERRLEVKVEKLSDLKDGETRTFGEGDHQVTATRHGDEVTVELKGTEQNGLKTLSCNLPSDTCTITTMGGGENARTMVMVNKSKTGEGKAEHTIQKVVIAGGDDPEGMVAVEGDGGLPLIVEGGEGLHGNHMFAIAHGDGVLLRCPEGDTTMRLGKDETNQGYRCPRHNLDLKEVKGERHVVRIVTQDKDVKSSDKK